MKKEYKITVHNKGVLDEKFSFLPSRIKRLKGRVCKKKFDDSWYLAQIGLGGSKSAIICPLTITEDIEITLHEKVFTALFASLNRKKGVVIFPHVGEGDLPRLLIVITKEDYQSIENPRGLYFLEMLLQGRSVVVPPDSAEELATFASKVLKAIHSIFRITVVDGRILQRLPRHQGDVEHSKEIIQILNTNYQNI